MYVPGSLAFYQQYGSSFQDRTATKIVQWATRGPFVHVAIITNEDGTTIEAQSSGIHASHLPENTRDTGIIIVDIMSKNIINDKVMPVDQERLQYALFRLKLKQGTPYNWLDILDQGVHVIARRFPVRLTMSGQYDCSNLAAYFLSLAGIELPDSFEYPYDVSPNDLAEWFGLLPDRHRIMP